MKRYLRFLPALAVLAIATLALTGCPASIAPGADPTVVNAERSEKIAFDTLNEFVHVEYENRAAMQAQFGPKVTEVADQVRTKAKGLFKIWDDAIDAYRLSRSTADQTKLEAAAAALQQLVADATDYLTKWKAGKISHRHAPIRPDPAQLGFIALLGVTAAGGMPGWLKFSLNSLLSIAGFLFTGGFGPLAVSLARGAVDLGDKIAEDAHQAGEMSDEEIAAWRSQRDDTMQHDPAWQPSTSSPAPESPAPGGGGGQ